MVTYTYIGNDRVIEKTRNSTREFIVYAIIGNDIMDKTIIDSVYDEYINYSDENLLVNILNVSKNRTKIYDSSLTDLERNLLVEYFNNCEYFVAELPEFKQAVRDLESKNSEKKFRTYSYVSFLIMEIESHKPLPMKINDHDMTLICKLIKSMVINQNIVMNRYTLSRIDIGMFCKCNKDVRFKNITCDKFVYYLMEKKPLTAYIYDSEIMNDFSYSGIYILLLIQLYAQCPNNTILKHVKRVHKSDQQKYYDYESGIWDYIHPLSIITSVRIARDVSDLSEDFIDRFLLT